MFDEDNRDNFRVSELTSQLRSDLSEALDAIDQTDILASLVLLSDDALRAAINEANSTIAHQTAIAANAGALILYRQRQRESEVH